MDSLSLFAIDLDGAYRRLTADFNSMARAVDGSPIFPADD